MSDVTKSKWRVFWEENWLTLLVVAVLAGAYLFLRTPGDDFTDVEEVEALLLDETPTVVVFYSNTCSICLVSKPKVDRLAADLADEARVLRLNVKSEVGRSLAGRWGVRGVPTFFVVGAGGEMHYAQAGAPDVSAIQDAVWDGAE
jgi:thiol-disulfide isomerase/thioredoxin